eukprot:gene12868-9200_t
MDEEAPPDILSLLKKCLNDADDAQTAKTVLPALEKYATCAPSLQTLFQPFGTEDVLMDFVLQDDSLTTLQSIVAIIGLLDLHLPPNSAISMSPAATATASPQAAALFRSLVNVLARVLLETWLLLHERDLEAFVFSATSVSNATASSYESRQDVLRRREDFLEAVFDFFRVLAYRWLGRPVSPDVAPSCVRVDATTYATFTPPLATLLHMVAQPTTFAPLAGYSDALLGAHAQASSTSLLQQYHAQSTENFRAVHLSTLAQLAVIDVVAADWSLFAQRAQTLVAEPTAAAAAAAATAGGAGPRYPNAQLLILLLQLLLNHRAFALDDERALLLQPPPPAAASAFD